MLSPRLTNCPTCTSIPALLANIECKIAMIAKTLYNNTVFLLNHSIDTSLMLDLLSYKRILTHKYCNPDYACQYTMDMIVSKVKILTGNCKSPCPCEETIQITLTTTALPVINKLVLEWDNIVNAPVVNVNSVSDWNALFDLPINGIPFTSVMIIGNTVTLFGGSNILVKENLFFESYNIISVLDTGSITDIATGAFSYCNNLMSASFPTLVSTQGFLAFSNSPLTTLSEFPMLEVANDNMFENIDNTILSFPKVKIAKVGAFAFLIGTTLTLPKLEIAGSYCFAYSSVKNYNFPMLINIGDFGFFSITNVESIYIPLCTFLGTSVSTADLFQGITGETLTLTIPIALMTCNSGAPDADIQYLQAHNTVTIITI